MIEFYEDGALELFNLKADESETQNLAAANPAHAAELRATLHAWLKRVNAQMPLANPHYHPSTAAHEHAQQPVPLMNEP